MGGFPDDYRDKNEIPLFEIVNSIENVRLDGPYKNESELRTHYEGIGGLRTPLVGIYVFVQHEIIDGSMAYELLRLKHYYMASGPNVSRGEWTPMIIK